MGDSGQRFPGGGMSGSDPYGPSGLYRSAAASSNEPGRPGGPKKGAKNHFPLALAGFALLALVFIAVLVMSRSKPKTDADDWGSAVSHVSGLQGHLIARWNGKAEYQLGLKPVDPTESAQFAYAAANPPEPLYLNVRLLDQAGFQICSKQVLFAFDPAKSAPPPISDAGPHAKKAVAERIAHEQAAQKAQLQSLQAQEQAREHGNDIFQNELGEDGKIVAVNAHGTLPCTAEQYKRVDYWDFATNFPTVADQDALLHHLKEKQARKELEARMAARRKKAAVMLSAFYQEGEDRATRYEAASAVLGTADGKSFYIAKTSDQATAASWASESSLIHYKCDQRANCALKHAGSTTVIYARQNE
ncbi:MAG: hypothetical protein KGM96_01145 [Acidobacteriota bacterium]|nr:hypothetical protein [Acidobacteriota bacterium]